MAKIQQQILEMFLRIKLSLDGPDLVEYLRELSLDNYEAFKIDDPEMDEFHKGYAFGIDSLIALFTECDKEAPNKAAEGDFT